MVQPQEARGDATNEPKDAQALMLLICIAQNGLDTNPLDAMDRADVHDGHGVSQQSQARHTAKHAWRPTTPLATS